MYLKIHKNNLQSLLLCSKRPFQVLPDHITPAHEFMHISSATLCCIEALFIFPSIVVLHVDAGLELNAYTHHGKLDGSLISGANFLK